MWEGVSVWEHARGGDPAGSGAGRIRRFELGYHNPDPIPAFTVQLRPADFYLHKLFAWPGCGFYLHNFLREAGGGVPRVGRSGQKCRIQKIGVEFGLFPFLFLFFLALLSRSVVSRKKMEKLKGKIPGLMLVRSLME